MRHVLASQGRQLTITQEEKALKAATQYPFPLYLDILLKDLKSWNSYDQEKWEILPPDTLEGLLLSFL